MASSGSFNTTAFNASDGTRYLTFAWTETEQSIEKNTTKISWTLKGAGTSAQWIGASAFKLTIDGKTVFSSDTYLRLEAGDLVASGTHTINHNADGTAKFSAYAEANIYAMPLKTGSGTFTLDTIPRASTFTVSNESPDMGTAVKFNITRASTSFTHKLTLTWGGEVSTIASNVATSADWTIPLALAADIPNSKSSGCIITCITYNGSTEIGRNTLGMTLVVPVIRPSIKTVAVSEAASGLASKFGFFVQSRSKFKVEIGATGANYATIKSYSTKILGKTYTGKTFTSDIITASGSVDVEVTVTDSRGFANSFTQKVTVTAYADPKISTFTAQRCDADGTANDEGEYVKIAYAFSVTSLNSKNDKTYTIAYKLKSDNTYTTLTTGNIYSANTTLIPSTIFSGDYAYDFKITVTDYFKSVFQVADISTAFTLMDFHSSGSGMAIGKVAEKEHTLEIALDTEFTKSLRVKRGIFIEDTRDINRTPDEYRALGKGVYYEFKKCATVALSDTSNAYCTIETFVQWQDSSGGSVKQILFDNDRIWYRYGESTTWGAWKPVLYRMAWQSVDNGVSYKIHNGMCTVRGNSNTTLSISPSGVVACTLPAVARPTVEIFGTLTTKATSFGQFSIGTDGKVTLWNLSTTSTYWAFTVTYPVD